MQDFDHQQQALSLSPKSCLRDDKVEGWSGDHYLAATENLPYLMGRVGNL